MQRGRKPSVELNNFEQELLAMQQHDMLMFTYATLNPVSAQSRICRIVKSNETKFKCALGVDRLYIIRIK